MITDIVGGLLGQVFGMIDKIIPDEGAREAAKLKAAKLHQEGQLTELDAMVKMAQGQMEINKTEAAHKSILVAGWRPFIGWICGLSLFWQFLGFPITKTILGIYNPELLPTLPVLETDMLFELVLAMLGMGGLRTYEKIKGKSRER